MDLLSHCQAMARYHHWAYARLLNDLEPIPDADYRAPAGLAFDSIHGTLNHLLLVDRLWHARFLGERFEITGLDMELETDRGALGEALLEQAERWIAFTDGLSADALEGRLHYANSRGDPRSVPYGETLLHVFNHGTHHRGQITAAVTRLGRPAPELDLLYYLIERDQ